MTDAHERRVQSQFGAALNWPLGAANRSGVRTSSAPNPRAVFPATGAPPPCTWTWPGTVVRAVPPTLRMLLS